MFLGTLLETEKKKKKKNVYSCETLYNVETISPVE